MIRILAIGDSYTAGEALPPDQSWPRQLEHSGTLGGAHEFTVVARTGWTAREALDAVLEANPAAPFDVVTVQVGVNDQYRGGTPESFGRDLEALLGEAVRRAAGGDPERVVFVSIPDWSVTPHAAGRDRARIAAEVDAHNRAARAVASALGSRYVDVTTASREAGPDLIAGDGLHPSEAMYRRWLAPIGAAIEEIAGLH